MKRWDRDKETITPRFNMENFRKDKKSQFYKWSKASTRKKINQVQGFT